MDLITLQHLLSPQTELLRVDALGAFPAAIEGVVYSGHEFMSIRHVLRDISRFLRRALGGNGERAEAASVREMPIERGVRHNLPGQLVVSLTSYPPRFPTLDLTLRRLLSQDVSPDAVVLWLAHGDAAMLPERVTALKQHGLTIRECADLKSAKKLIPALDAYPDAFIATADDDVDYPMAWLRQLVDAYREPGEIVCLRGRRIVLAKNGGFGPYAEWPIITEPEAGPHVFPTGSAGVLYPPHALNPEVADAAAYLRLCPFADDVWFYWMGRRAGRTYRVMPGGKLRLWKGSQATNLWLRNRHGGNDRQIAAMIEAYGMPG